jgi:hypothetical protein
MSNGSNGSFDHLIGQLDRRLERIEMAIDNLAGELDGKHEKLNGRVNQLEHRNAEVRGGWTVLALIGTVAGTVGGIASKWFSG